MEYFFLLGSHPALSAAELAAVLPSWPGVGSASVGGPRVADEKILLWRTDQALDAAALLDRLGGTIKIGLLAGRIQNDGQIVDALTAYLPAAGRVFFGFSIYGQPPAPIKDLALQVKKKLLARGQSSRWVVSREKTLSSVVVEKNKLLTKGGEALVIRDGDGWLIGFTAAVQPFADFSRRDYGRPARDDYSGLLPPKLARIMLNLGLAGSPAGAVVLDPFCGSGTVLMEALLMGAQKAFGSDLSPRALRDAENNLSWLKKNYPAAAGVYELKKRDAAALAAAPGPWPRAAVDAIVTEPYLGAPRGPVDYPRQIRQLNDLYGRFLAAAGAVLRPAGRIVMVWPIFRAAGVNGRLQPGLQSFKIIPPWPPAWPLHPAWSLTERGTLVYGRPDQKIWREIVILSRRSRSA